MKFLDTTETVQADIVADRGTHDVHMEDADGSLFLAGVQPSMTWVSSGATGSGSAWVLQYGTAAELMLAFASFDGEALAAYPLAEHIVSAACLSRLWAEVRKGMPADAWVACTKGTFKARLRAAARSPAVDPTQLQLTIADMYEVPRLTSCPAYYVTLVWAESSFPSGPASIGGMEYQAETRLGTAGIANDSALRAYLQQSLAAADAASISAGTSVGHLASMRARSRAAMVVQHWEASAWPESLDKWSRPGPSRELDAMAASAYRKSGGVGEAAQRVVLERLHTALESEAFGPVGELLRTSPVAAHGSLVNAIRRAQQVFRIEGGDVITLGSLERLAALLGQRMPLILSEEVQRLTLADRVEYFVGLGEMATTVAAMGSAGGSATSHDAPSGSAGARRSARFDESKLLELKASPAYIDQKRAGLAAVAAGNPFAALRVFLAGRLPAPARPSGAATGLAPLTAAPAANPLIVFHVILFDDAIEAWTIDAQLHPLQELRAHIPAYLGEVATGAMRGGPWRCKLTDFVKALKVPSTWADAPPDIENDVWRIVLATKFGEEAHLGFTMERVPAAALYTDAYRLHAIREVAIAVTKAIGILDIPGEAPSATSPGAPTSPSDVLDEAIDRHAVHGMLPNLRANVRSSTHALVCGVWGEFGGALKAAKSSRDCTTSFPTKFVRYPSQAVSEWQQKTIVYENMASRRREESLAEAGAGGALSIAFPAPGLDSFGSDSGYTSIADGGGATAAAGGLADLERRMREVEMQKGKGGAGERCLPISFSKGVFSREGLQAQYSKEKISAQLKELSVEPSSVCIDWILTQAAPNSTRADCWRDCRSKKLHAEDSSFHRVVPGLKLGACRCDGKAGVKRVRTKE
jgi:hypothetical protein